MNSPSHQDRRWWFEIISYFHPYLGKIPASIESLHPKTRVKHAQKPALWRANIRWSTAAVTVGSRLPEVRVENFHLELVENKTTVGRAHLHCLSSFAGFWAGKGKGAAKGGRGKGPGARPFWEAEDEAEVKTCSTCLLLICLTN